MKVNCAALPAELLESELFGHERGAFTGAATTRIGKFEQADGGTLMLDEIGEMKPALQAKLLHVLQDAEFTKLGSNKRIQVDVRIVAATNRDLEKMMVSGEFREDLYYRLKVIELTVPAAARAARRDPDADRLLRRPLLAQVQPARRARSPTSCGSCSCQYEWPGNIRELENMIKRVVILQDEQLVVREIQRNMQRAAAAPAVAVAAAVPLAAVAAVGAGGAAVRHAARHAAVPSGRRARGRRGGEESSRPPEGGGSLASVAKAAAMKAERAAIEHDAAPGALEPPQGRADSRRELQDAAQQDQGVRNQSSLNSRVDAATRVYLFAFLGNRVPLRRCFRPFPPRPFAANALRDFLTLRKISTRGIRLAQPRGCEVLHPQRVGRDGDLGMSDHDITMSGGRQPSATPRPRVARHRRAARTEREDARGPGSDRARRRYRRHRADPRRERHRQGAGGARHPQRVAAP